MSLDISLFSYASKSFNHSSQTTSNRGMFFKPDGTKVYIASANTVYQYSLSTAWDISTASYDSKSVSISSQVSDCRGLHFSSDGTKMYAGDRAASDAVYQYTLSTAWDVSTASYASKSLSIVSQVTDIRGLTMNSDGTKLYALNSNEIVYQYGLSTAWDLSTGSYDSKNYNSASQDSNAHGLAMPSDNTQIFISGRTNDKMFQYDLSTASDISTASYASKSLNFFPETGRDSFSQFVGDTDSKIYVGLDDGGGIIYQYDGPSTVTSDIKSIAGVAQADIKSIAGVTNANIKSVAGVANQ